jgi:hypothetical protein
MNLLDATGLSRGASRLRLPITRNWVDDDRCVSSSDVALGCSGKRETPRDKPVASF